MPIDLNRFIGTFFDETHEHLESIEDKAMSLAAPSCDPEVLNAIFRAAHSIKGGSATFGFTQLAEATHEMETLFDELRKGSRGADDTTVRLLLDACDVFRAHLARLKDGEREADPAMESVRQRLSGYRGEDTPAASATPAAPTGEEAFFIPDASATPQAYGFFTEVAPAPVAAGCATRYGLFEPPQPVSPGGPASEPAGEGEAQPASEPARGRSVESSIRVSVEKIDRIVNLVGELVIAQAMMQQTAGRSEGEREERLGHSLATLDRNTRELQQAVMSIRMMPIEFVFSRFPRLVYDLSTRLGKQVQLRTTGHETELDKELIELLIDPLTHLVRNAIDHGIEAPPERRRAGKAETGTVSMRATHRGGSVLIEVCDDGEGLDRARILAKARELGLSASEDLTDDEVWAFIFEPGFSTAREVTEFSGRGVGMDVVRRNITALGGSVYVGSVKGEGTTITIQLPLTLAVLDGMVVTVADEPYIVPLEFVAEAIKPAAADIRSVANQASLVAVRGEHLPILRLEDVVQLPATDRERPEPLCLVVEVDSRRAALLVDSLVGQQQLVVKSLESNLHRVPGVAGATILGDGHVALILDVSALVRGAGARSRSVA